MRLDEPFYNKNKPNKCSQKVCILIWHFFSLFFVFRFVCSSKSIFTYTSSLHFSLITTLRFMMTELLSFKILFYLHSLSIDLMKTQNTFLLDTLAISFPFLFLSTIILLWLSNSQDSYHFI